MDGVFFTLLAVVALAPAMAVLAACHAAWEASRWLGVLAALAAMPVYLALVVGVTACAHLLLPKVEEGEFPFPEHPVAKAWVARLLLHRVVGLPGLANLLYGSPFLRTALLKGLGTKIAFDHMMSSDACVLDPELTTIGPSVMLGGSVWISSHSIDETTLYLKRVVIGEGTKVFIRSVIFPGCRLGKGVTIGMDARLATDVIVGDDAYVGMGCMIGPRTRIGAAVVIGHGVTVGADCVIDDHAIIDSGTVVPKGARVGAGRYGKASQSPTASAPLPPPSSP
jgi:UDP-3-O-[3-hydroxymyristoyl] glucosamine N-acyltransferase